MFRMLVKAAAARSMSSTRLDKMARANRHRHLPFVVYYHRVVERLNAGDGLALPAMQRELYLSPAGLGWSSAATPWRWPL